MKFTKKSLLPVSILIIACFGFISSIFAVQPGWTKTQVIKELGEPNNIMQDPTYGEVWTYTTTPKKENFFDSMTGSYLISSFVDIFTPSLPVASTVIGNKVSDGVIGTASVGAEETLDSALGSKDPKTTSAVIIHFDSDGRVAEPKMYHGEQDTSTVQTQIISRKQSQTIRDGGRLNKHNKNSTEKLTSIVVKEPKHVYVDTENVCHRPYCKNIVGIEKRTLQRFATLEQALQAENKKCDSCMQP